MQDLAYTDRPVSQVGKFTHRYVMPLSSYGGQNDRIILDGQRAGRVSIRNGMGLIQHSIQAASHNYAGLYGRDMDLHHFALEQLPVNISPGNQVLEDAMCRAVRKHFQVDFCVATSTGYGANLLALSAIPDENWLVVFDGKSHNSLFVGVYLGRPGRVRKFIHNDMKHLEEVLLEEGKQFTHTLVVVEGFYR
jgi:serine palmitoyltransferase